MLYFSSGQCIDNPSKLECLSLVNKFDVNAISSLSNRKFQLHKLECLSGTRLFLPLQCVIKVFVGHFTQVS